MANYHDQIGTDCRPDLCFDGIDALPIERFDSQVLLDPFEEQFDLPAAFIILGNLAGVAIGDVGQQDNILMMFLINQSDPSQGIRITVFGLWSRQPDDLVALQPGRGVNRRGGFPVELQVFSGPGDKPASLAMKMIQPFEIQVPPVHNVDTAGQDRDHIQEVYIVSLSIGNMDKSGDSALQIHHCVKFDGSFVFSELCPLEQRQTQIDGRGVQDFNRFGQLIFAIQFLCMSDQYHGQILINFPWPRSIGIRERTQGDALFDAHVIATSTECVKGRGQIPKAVPERKLSKTHTQELIPAFKLPYTVISFVLMNNLSKIVFGDNIHKLRKNDPASVHKTYMIKTIELRRHWQATRSNR